MPSFGFDTTRFSLWEWCRLRGAGHVPVVAGIPKPRHPSEPSVFHARRSGSPHPGISRLVASAITASGCRSRASRLFVAWKTSRSKVHLHDLAPVGGPPAGRRDWRRFERFAQACARRVVRTGLLIDVTAASRGVVGALMPARRGIAPRADIPFCQAPSRPAAACDSAQTPRDSEGAWLFHA